MHCRVVTNTKPCDLVTPARLLSSSKVTEHAIFGIVKTAKNNQGGIKQRKIKRTVVDAFDNNDHPERCICDIPWYIQFPAGFLYC